MLRCIELARQGAGHVSPNPMVGCVIVHDGQIIGEGWHQQFGGPHAEVSAIHSVKSKELLKDSVLYVNLEPCSHHGKTPPCADLIISEGIRKVVIGMIDPFEKVSGQGVQKLREAGVEVITGIEEEQCRELNKRFITFVSQKRPYVILKWAQTSDGFIAPLRDKLTHEEFEAKRHITGFIIQKLVHQWRSEEDAILVGTNTIRTDNPALNVRAWQGRSPLRITMDKDLSLPSTQKIFDGTQRTLIFTDREKTNSDNLIFDRIDFSQPVVQQILERLYALQIQSLIVEGGLFTLNAFIQDGLWDEAQVFVTPAIMTDGVKAPDITGDIVRQTTIDGSRLTIYKNS